jgi:type II secretory pathway predicted ATPase ExeA
MFKDFYGFTKNPFDKQSLSVKDAFLSKDHKEMTSCLSYLNKIRGIGFFTSAPGFGKTYALNCFTNSLDRNLNEIVYISLSTVSVVDFYRQLCAALGFDAPFGKAAMFRAIQDRLYYMFKEKRKPVLLILDEAQKLSSDILNDLKIIMNHEFDSLNCFTVALVGETHLNGNLEKPPHEALRQRIVINYSFQGLDNDETEAYILHKLQIAGATASILGEGTLTAISGYAGGCPRLIDNLMTKALMLGAQMDKHTLDSDVIMAAVNNLALS